MERPVLDRRERANGAHCGEGPVLAILAMLACKSTLRVAAGGTAPPNPLRCAPLAWAAPGRDGKAGSPIEQKSRFGSRRLGGSITTGKRF